MSNTIKTLVQHKPFPYAHNLTTYSHATIRIPLEIIVLLLNTIFFFSLTGPLIFLYVSSSSGVPPRHYPGQEVQLARQLVFPLCAASVRYSPPPPALNTMCWGGREPTVLPAATCRPKSPLNKSSTPAFTPAVLFLHICHPRPTHLSSPAPGSDASSFHICPPSTHLSSPAQGTVFPANILLSAPPSLHLVFYLYTFTILFPYFHTYRSLPPQLSPLSSAPVASYLLPVTSYFHSSRSLPPNL